MLLFLLLLILSLLFIPPFVPGKQRNNYGKEQLKRIKVSQPFIKLSLNEHKFNHTH